MTQTFNPNDHVMQIKNKGGASDYLPVQWRLVWFRDLCPEGTIETEILQLDLDRETEEETFAWNSETRRSEKVVKRANGFALFRAIVKDGKGGIATGTKSEKAASFPDYIEKAETGAIGRALAALGYGTQFAPEMNEEHRLADAPVDRPASNGHKPEQEAGRTAQLREDDEKDDASVLAEIRALLKSMGRGDLKNPLSGKSARLYLKGLQAEYQKQAAATSGK